MFIPGTIPIDELDKHINQAISLKDTPIYRTMRATLSLMRYGERLSILNSQLTEQLQTDLQISLTEGADNGILLAWIGHAQGYFLRDHDFSLQLSKKALELSPHSWLCWMFRATTLSYANKGVEAQMAIRKTLRYPIPCSFRPFVLSNAAQAECLAGNFDQATSYATEALKYNSKFQATSRTLLASYSMTGDERNARKIFKKMCERENDLSIDLIKSDDYPIPSTDIKSMLVQGLKKIDFGVNL